MKQHFDAGYFLRVVITTLLVVCSIHISSAYSKENTQVPEEVQDLRYGVILYHFFQQSYFEALTESYIGELRGDMPYHQQSAKLLRGGMNLSYGMGKQAEVIFKELLDELSRETQRDRAWFYLGKLYYLRGEKELAKQVFANIQTTLPESLHEELIYLRANLQLSEGDLGSAETTINQLPETSPWLGYYYFNRGAALSLNGEIEQAVQAFHTVRNLPIRGEEGNTLKDRANIASGFAYLGGDNLESAIADFLQVRLESPLVEQAMLGYGWAAARQEDYQRALSPWQALNSKSVMNTSVQESLLAVPFAYEKLDAKATALEEYQRAVAVFESQLVNIKEAINVFNDVPIVQTVSEQGLGSDWVVREDYLPINPQAPYLVELIAKEHFQSSVKNLSDLVRMQRYLFESEERLQSMETVYEVQKRAWQENLNQSKREEYRQAHQQLQQVKQQLLEQKALADQEADGRRYVSGEERELWQVAEHAEQMIESLKSAGEDVAEEERLLKFYQGQLKWQASEQDSAKRWEFEKQLNQVEVLLTETQSQLEILESLQADRYQTEYNDRITGLKTRLNNQQAGVDQALAQAESVIRTMAIADLQAQERRLTYYIAQAKLGVARLYDLGSEEFVQ